MISLPRRVTCTVVGLALVTAMAQVAYAQPRGGRGFGRGFGASSVRLATLDQVQSELKMTDEQKAKMAEVDDQLRSDRRELFQQGSGDFSEVQDEMEKLNNEAAAKIAAVLDEAQRQRLSGIAIQVNGPTALTDPIVVNQLHLSDEVKSKLNDAQAENWQAMRDAMDQAQDMSREERREKFTELRDEAGQKLLAVLSPEQRAEFDQLKGEPVEIDMSQLRGRGRGGN